MNFRNKSIWMNIGTVHRMNGTDISVMQNGSGKGAIFTVFCPNKNLSIRIPGGGQEARDAAIKCAFELRDGDN